jgi:hypothetical protein
VATANAALLDGAQCLKLQLKIISDIADAQCLLIPHKALREVSDELCRCRDLLRHPAKELKLAALCRQHECVSKMCNGIGGIYQATERSSRAKVCCGNHGHEDLRRMMHLRGAEENIECLLKVGNRAFSVWDGLRVLEQYGNGKKRRIAGDQLY